MNQELSNENNWEWSPSVFEAFEAEVRARLKVSRRHRAYGLLSALFATVMLALLGLSACGFPIKVEPLWMIPPSFLNYVILALIRRRKDDAVRNAAGRFSKSITPGMVDLYTDWNMRNTYGEGVSELVTATLRNVLPQLTSTDRNLLPRDKAGRLAHALVSEKSQSLILSGLKALGQLGGVETEKSLAALAAGKGKCKSEAVKRTAGETLEKVRSRTDHERSAATLLRPADEGSTSESLLRAAGTCQVTDPQVLLRPGSS